MEFLRSLNYYLREKNKSDILILILGFLNPFIYIVSPIALAVIAVIEVALVFFSGDELYKKFWKGFLLAITFYGVGIVHIKLYYWVFGLSLPFIIYKYINRLKGKRLWFLIVYAVYVAYLGIILVSHPIKGDTVAEYIRYLMCFIIVFITLVSFRDLSDVKNLFGSFKLVGIVNIISGVILTVLALTGHTNDMGIAHTKLISVDVYLSLDNFRVATFFSDPNLYYAFFIFLLAIYEFVSFVDKDSKVRFLDVTNVILLIAVVSSFSRTAMLIVGVYLVIKFIAVYILKANIRLNNIVWLSVVGIAIIIFIFFSGPILNWFNWVVYNFTILIGRKHALVYSSSFTDSSRMLSWKVALGSVKGHWIFGRGINFWHQIYYMPPHNSFIMTLQSGGLIALGFLIGLFIYAIRKIPVFILLLLIAPMCTLDLQDFVLLAMLMGIGVVFIDSGFANYGRKIKCFG